MRRSAGLAIGCNANRIAHIRGSSPNRPSLEAAGRIALSILPEAASGMGATLVATGTADDQAETVLLRLLRSAGARGMGGIRVRRGAIIRPLLHVRRAERARPRRTSESCCETRRTRTGHSRAIASVMSCSP
jgi:hypothetical protein